MRKITEYFHFFIGRKPWRKCFCVTEKFVKKLCRWIENQCCLTAYFCQNVLMKIRNMEKYGSLFGENGGVGRICLKYAVFGCRFWLVLWGDIVKTH